LLNYFLQRELANKLLNEFKSNPDAWTYVDKIIDGAQNPNTKFIALQILDEAVNVRTLPFTILLNSFYNMIDSMENIARRLKTGNKVIYSHCCPQAV
jgi:hypothetical protein